MNNEQQTAPTYAELRLAAAEILNTIEANEGELTAADETALQLIQSKLVAGCFAIDNRRQSIAQAKEMIKELQGRVKAAEKTAAFLESVVVSTMEAMGQKKIESYKKFSLAKKPGRVEITEPDNIPAHLCTAKVELSFDMSLQSDTVNFAQLIGNLKKLGQEYTYKLTPSKTAIKEAILKGDAVPGAQLVENEFSFRIK